MLRQHLSLPLLTLLCSSLNGPEVLGSTINLRMDPSCRRTETFQRAVRARPPILMATSTRAHPPEGCDISGLVNSMRGVRCSWLWKGSKICKESVRSLWTPLFCDGQPRGCEVLPRWEA